MQLGPYRGAEIWEQMKHTYLMQVRWQKVKPQEATNGTKHRWVARLQTVMLGNRGSLIHFPTLGSPETPQMSRE